MFENLLDFVSDFAASDLSTWVFTESMEELADRVKSLKCVTKSARCWRCSRQAGKDIFCSLVHTFLHVAGPSCVDFTPQGGRNGQWGDSFAATFVWICLVRFFRFQAIIHENVEGYNLAFMELCLGDWYVFQSVVWDPSQHGFPIYRPRRITIILSKEAINGTLSPFTWMQKICRRRLVADWKLFLVATLEDLEAELQWCMNRPTSTHKKPNLALISASQRKIRSENKYARVLTTQDLEFLEQYRTRFGGLGSNMVCYLNQHPLNHQQVSCDVYWEHHTFAEL